MICDWKGPRTGIAEIHAEDVISLDRHSRNRKLGELYEIGRLKLRVVQFPVAKSYGAYADIAAVMLESPHAQLYWLYREHAERLIRLVLNFEARVRGFMLKPVEGQVMPFTAKLADKLL